MNKVYNDQTGNYKIQIYVDGSYFCSTDQAKSLKAAKSRFSELAAKHPNQYPKELSASRIHCEYAEA